MPAPLDAVPASLIRRHRRLRRALRRRRRPLGALLAGLAVVATVHAARAPATPAVDVLVAAHDLAPGTVLSGRHLTRAAFLRGSIPAGTLTRDDVLGRRVVGPVRSGEPITDVRLLDVGLLARYPGSAAVPVRLGDAAAARLLHVGQLVTVLAAHPESGGAAVAVAERVPVLALPRDSGGLDPGAGALVVLALDEGTAREVAGASARAYLTAIAVR